MRRGGIGARVPEDLVLFTHLRGAAGERNAGKDQKKDVQDCGLYHITSCIGFVNVGFAVVRSVASANTGILDPEKTSQDTKPHSKLLNLKMLTIRNRALPGRARRGTVRCRIEKLGTVKKRIVAQWAFSEASWHPPSPFHIGAFADPVVRSDRFMQIRASQ
jgi:hypothetical protein